jgi:hypothetical protein
MPMVMIRCPQTGKAVATGIDTDPESFRKLPDVLAFVLCPHCGLEHAWRRDEAWLAGSAPPKET